MCVKTLITTNKTNLESLNVCKQKCAGHGNLWPLPSSPVRIGKKLVPLDVSKIHVIYPNIVGNSRYLKEAINVFQANQQRKAKNIFHCTSPKIGVTLKVFFQITDPSDKPLELTTDESYQLTISYQDGILCSNISSATFYGARHGLETLNQLIIIDDLRWTIRMPTSAKILDKPAYPYRGILIDTSRSFITIDTLKRTLDAMGASKLNSLHWHITDADSFTFESKTYPELTRYGAYSREKVYTEEDIKELSLYASVRGVRIIPELDAPAHVAEGWHQFAPGTVVCFRAEPWKEFCASPPCGQIDPTNNKVYDILGGIYRDMVQAFSPTMFHMGGDEVNMNCWNQTSSIQYWLESNGLDNSLSSFHYLWKFFQSKAYNELVAANGGKDIPAIVWTSTLTGDEKVAEYLNPEKYIIQIWTSGTDQEIKNLATKNFKLIFSNFDALYLDCGYGAWLGTGNNWCSPYIDWKKMYDNDPRSLMKGFGIHDEETLSLALGGEAAMWSEQTDSSSVGSKIWPRAAAMAERLWTAPSSDAITAQTRFLEHRERLVDLGVSPDVIQPQYCRLNEGACF